MANFTQNNRGNYYISTATIIAIILIAAAGYWFYQFQLKPSSSLEVKNGGKIFITLTANPTTGYNWNIDYDPNYIEMLNREYLPESELLGSGGKEIFTFIALKQGETEIKFYYSRPWENGAPPAEEKFYEIIIK